MICGLIQFKKKIDDMIGAIFARWDY